jgi:alpha-beta hydrolase superfamily lysophospholipase
VRANEGWPNIAPVNPSETVTPATQIEVRIDRDTRLPGRAWCAAQPRAQVAIVHGLGEHSGRYAALAGALVDRRFTVVSLDLPGHGEAPGPRGDAPSWNVLRDQCIPAMFTLTRGMPGQPPELPTVLMGHSLGGVLALDYALAHPKTITGLVLSAPAVKTPPPPGWKVGLAKLAGAAAPGMGFSNGIEPGAISRDPEVLKFRASDPLVHGKISPRIFFGFEEARARVIRDMRRLQVPTLILQGAADRVVNPQGALELSGLAPHGMARLLTYRDGYHEIFNDLDREKAIHDLIGWLDAVLVV